MSNLKFRGQRTKDGAWLYLDLLEEVVSDKPSDFFQYNLKPETIGQQVLFSGKTFYVNDIVKVMAARSGKSKLKPYIGKIKTQGNGFTVAIIHKGRWWRIGSINYTNMELMGNIFDNPEIIDNLLTSNENSA